MLEFRYDVPTNSLMNESPKSVRQALPWSSIRTLSYGRTVNELPERRFSNEAYAVKVAMNDLVTVDYGT